jgi:hypothetical protein
MLRSQLHPVFTGYSPCLLAVKLGILVKLEHG